jgi:hypothetical protein
MPDRFLVFVPGSATPPSGPFSLAELQAKVWGRQIPNDAQVARVGDSVWVPVHQIAPPLEDDDEVKTLVAPTVVERVYEVTVDGETIVGPVSFDQLRRGVHEGKLPLEARVRTSVAANWRPIGDVIAPPPAPSPYATAASFAPPPPASPAPAPAPSKAPPQFRPNPSSRPPPQFRPGPPSAPPRPPPPAAKRAPSVAPAAPAPVPAPTPAPAPEAPPAALTAAEPEPASEPASESPSESAFPAVRRIRRQKKAPPPTIAKVDCAVCGGRVLVPLDGKAGVCGFCGTMVGAEAASAAPRADAPPKGAPPQFSSFFPASTGPVRPLHGDTSSPHGDRELETVVLRRGHGPAVIALGVVIVLGLLVAIVGVAIAIFR